MQKLLNRFIGKGKEKNSGSYSYYLTFGDKIFSTNYSDPKLAYEGYTKNIIVYKCISTISDMVSLMRYKQVKVDDDGKITDTINNSEILKKLNKPHPSLNRQTFLRRTASQRLIYDNYYIEKEYKPRGGSFQNKPPLFLYPLRPDFITIQEGENHMASWYTYSETKQGKTIRFPVSIKGQSNLIHGMGYNPLSDYSGLSPLVPAGYSIDLHNEISKQDIGFMQNGARPSGILTIPAGVNADEKQLEKLKSDIKEKYTSAENKGKPMVLNNGMTWQQISMSRTDSDATEVKKMAAQEIGLAFKVPMDLLNIVPSKFDNLDVAYEMLFYDAVLPIAQDIVNEFNQGLLPLYPDSEGTMLIPDFSHTKVLRDSNIRVMERINPISFISNNEKRQMVQYDELDGEDELKQPVKMTPEKNAYIAEQMNDGLTYKEAEQQANIIYG